MTDGLCGFSEINDLKDGEFSMNAKTGYFNQDFYDFPAFFKWMGGLRPVLYVGAFPQYMSPNSPQQNDIVNFFINYFGTGTASTNTSASNKVFRKYWKGNSWVFWNNGVSAATTWGANSELNFMHNPKAEFTLFFVWKNLINETSGTTIIPFANSNNTGQRGHIFAMTNSGNFKNPFLRIDNGTSPPVTINFPSFNKTKDHPPLIYSIRVKDIHNRIGTKIGQSYVNGLWNSDVVLHTVFTSGNASNIFRIGNRPSGDLNFRGYFGELLIFDKMISEELHTQIIYYLKLKYKI